MIVERHTAGLLETNAYVLVDAAEAVVVDPAEDAEELLAIARRHGATLTGVWLTHAHFDHVAGLEALLELAGPVPVHLDPRDRPLFDHAAAAAAMYGIAIRQPTAATQPLADGQSLRVGAVDVRCLATPGHAPGHIAFHVPTAGLVLSGDALFRGSIGRTDLPFGDLPLLLASIRTKLLTLPPETRVLPGHGEPTTVAAEAAGNPYLQPGARF